jgi:hypothetical protein
MADELYNTKMRFAALLQRESKDKRLAVAPIVAKQTLGKDADLYPMYTIKISEEWPFDPEVIAEIDRLDLLPIPKEVILRDLYAIASDRYTEKKDRLVAYRHYMDANGWTKSTKDNGNNPNELLTHLQALYNAATNPVDT